MFIIRNKKIFFIISSILVLFSIASIFIWGLNPGIEFTGGSITEVRYTGEMPNIDVVRSNFSELSFGSVLVQPTGNDGFIVRTKDLTTDEHSVLLETLSFKEKYPLVEERYNLVGPSIGDELRTKAWIAIGAVLLGIILFIAFVFRKVSQSALSNVKTTVRSWHYGLIAIIALGHDILIPAGIFAFLGSMFIDAQIDVLFVTALLAILGYSVNDTIVVFDRVRENLRKNQELKLRKSFDETVGESLEQTYVRSINTSLTTLAVLLALYFLGGEATKNFALVLSIGVVAGTYSSLFLAAPLLSVVGRLKVKEK